MPGYTPKLTRPSWRRFLPLGAAASTAYLLEMLVDMRVTRNRYDDLVLWGGFLSDRARTQRIIGLLGHYSLGIGLAAVYDALAPSLPAMPGWLRGLVFIQVENVLTFPTVALGDLFHPAVKRGTLPPLATGEYFWLEAARHAAYGITLGSLYRAE